MKKNHAKSGLRADTSANHGSVMHSSSAPPASQCIRRQTEKSRRHRLCSTSTAPGITTPISPLLSTARPTPAQAASIQRACERWLLSGCCAISTPHSVSVSAAARPASSVRKWLLATIQVVEPQTISACQPVRTPHRRRAVKPTRKTVASPASPGHRRAANSLTPNSHKLSAPPQYCSGGFSK